MEGVRAAIKATAIASIPKAHTHTTSHHHTNSPQIFFKSYTNASFLPNTHTKGWQRCQAT
jgi:hypothetical protein